MNPKNSFTGDPMREKPAESFPEPRTIPGGWDVSAFMPGEDGQPFAADAAVEPYLPVTGSAYVLFDEA